MVGKATQYRKTSILLLCILLLSLTGCTTRNGKTGYYWFDNDEAEIQEPDVRTVVLPPEGSGLAYRPDSRDIEMYKDRLPQSGYQDPLPTGFEPTQTHKNLNDYASQLAMGLMESAHLNSSELVGVSSFVRLNKSLQQTTILGNQLSELLIAELQGFGVSVVDFKLTRVLMVTSSGDIALSRNIDHLLREQDLNYILTGTMIEETRGVRVNARIVSTDNRRIVASSSLYVPAFIVTSLNPTPLANHPEIDDEGYH